MKKKGSGFLMENLLLINEEELFEIACQTGFIKRKRLIHPLEFLSAVCLTSATGIASYNDIAAHIDADSGLVVSRQAIWKKVTGACEEFFKKVLAVAMANRIHGYAIEGLSLRSTFKRILIEDSTIIGLPIRLFPDFSGVANGQAKVCNARVQCIYDLRSGQFVRFSIDPYSKNDLEAASELVLQEGDLVLRDRGYLSQDEIQRHIHSNAHCIYRHKFSMILKDPMTEKPIDLLAILKKEIHVDMKIMLNNEAKTIVRLIAYPVSTEVADNRRRRAKKENRKTPSTEYLELLSWSIYLTTITDEQIDHLFIHNAYALRWRIETIFKSWKSNMGFDKVHNVSKTQLNVLMLARFIMIVTCIQFIFEKCRSIIKTAFNRNLSLLKLTKYLFRHHTKIVCILQEIDDPNRRSAQAITAVAKFCTYEKRKRLNYQQKLDALFSQQN